MIPIPPHRARLPDPTGLFKKAEREDREFLVELVAALQRELNLRIMTNTAGPELLLFSPAGKVFAITVNDAGAVTTVLRSDV